MTPHRPRQPTPSERLDGVLADLERAATGEPYVPREEVGAILGNLRLAMKGLGLGRP